MSDALLGSRRPPPRCVHVGLAQDENRAKESEAEAAQLEETAEKIKVAAAKIEAQLSRCAGRVFMHCSRRDTPWVLWSYKAAAPHQKRFCARSPMPVCAACCRAEMLEKARQIAGQQSIRKALQEADYSE